MASTLNDFWPWLAGFWEGEGSVYRNGRYYTLDIGQKDITPLEYIQRNIGGKITVQHHQRYGPHYRWMVNKSDRIITILEAIYPYLHSKVRIALVNTRLLQLRTIKPRARWTITEEASLREQWKNHSTAEIASSLGRTAQSISTKAWKLQLLRRSRREHVK